MSSSLKKFDRRQIIQSLLWDYNISVDEIEKLLSGEVDRVNHYTFESFFRKMLENLPWYTVILLLPIEKVKETLTLQLVNSLRQPSLRKKYNYVRNKLQKII